MTRTRLLPIAFLLPALAVTGCSGAKAPGARVSGQLTIDGKPIRGGTLVFHAPDGVSYNGSISPDGTYSATDLPEGELIVTVETEHLNPGKTFSGPPPKDMEKRMKVVNQQQPPGGAVAVTPPAELYVKIPEKYTKKNTSPLSITLTRGRQVKDLELTSR